MGFFILLMMQLQEPGALEEITIGYLDSWYQLNNNKNRKTSVLIHSDQCGQPIILS